jgi:hypothetical protein
MLDMRCSEHQAVRFLQLAAMQIMHNGCQYQLLNLYMMDMLQKAMSCMPRDTHLHTRVSPPSAVPPQAAYTHMCCPIRGDTAATTAAWL